MSQSPIKSPLVSILCPILMSSLGLHGCAFQDEIPIASGYAAKNICSDYFVSGLNPETIKIRLVAPQIKPFNKIWRVNLDVDKKNVTVSDIIFGNRYAHEAHYREGFGCTLLHGSTNDELNQQIPPLKTWSIPTDTQWPIGAGGTAPPVSGIDYGTLERSVENAFEEDRDLGINTLSVAVAYKDQLLMEKYAMSATAQSRLIGWSMTKSFTSTLVGLLFDQGKLDPKKAAPVAEWKNTEKQNITLENLLHMAGGLQWSETSKGSTPDQGIMLFRQPDYAGYYLKKPVVAEPGVQFNYSTGATSLIARIVQHQLGGSINHTYQFMQDSLFHKIAISSAVLEYDEAGQPSGGANLYMTTRDWTRLGLLYLRQGNWFGEQILSKEWIQFATSPSPANAQYGAQIWLNTEQKKWPALPADTYAFVGFEGQYVIIVPQHDLVVTRLGATFETDRFALEALISGVISSLPIPATPTAPSAGSHPIIVSPVLDPEQQRTAL